MKETTLSKICLSIVIVGIVLFSLTYEPEFKNTTISKLKNDQHNSKGIIFARVDYVIKNTPITQIIINDGETSLLYYPKETKLEKNNFITAYVTIEDNNTLYAYKVVKDD